MVKEDQIRFVSELFSALKGKILADIKNGRIPEEWDGIELRELIADQADNQRASRCFMGRKRLANYRNTVLINNL